MSDTDTQPVEFVIPVAVLLMLTSLVNELDASDSALGERIVNRLKNLKNNKDTAEKYPESLKLIDACVADVEATRNERIKGN